MLSTSKKRPKRENALSEFMRNASDEEQERVFMKVIDESIQDQLAIVKRAEEIRAEQAQSQVAESSDHSYLKTD